MHTGDVADCTIHDIIIGKEDLEMQSACGTHLLLSATVNRHTKLSKNTVFSAQLCVTYNHKNIPSGVMYVCVILCTTETRYKPLTFFVDHTLSPAKSVWVSLPQDVIDSYREMALIQRALQPALDHLKFNDVSTFLKNNFCCSSFSFMDNDGSVYSLTPNGYGVNNCCVCVIINILHCLISEKVYASSDVQSNGINPQDCIRNIQ